MNTEYNTRNGGQQTYKVSVVALVGPQMISKHYGHAQHSHGRSIARVQNFVRFRARVLDIAPFHFEFNIVTCQNQVDQIYAGAVRTKNQTK